MKRQLALLSCALFVASATAAVAAEATKVAVGAPPIGEVLAAYVAKEEGLFAKHGLDVDFLPTASNQTLVAAALAGSHQFVSISPTVLLQAMDSGIDLVAVANCGVTSKRTAVNVGIAVRSGVEIKQPGDLKGKKIGLPGFGGTLDILLRQWLKQNQIDPKSITIIEVPIPSTADVLKSGSIDGIVAGQPSLGRAVELSNGYVAFNFMKDLPENLPYTGFVSTREWASKNGDTVRNFQAAVVEAAAFAKANPAKTQEYVAKYTKLPLEVVKRIELPECNPVASQDQFEYFDRAMRADNMLQNKIDLSKIVFK
jgi:NitT/TauT family transport system substrate-binding protein